MFNTDFNIK